MPEHYSKATVEATVWCAKCFRATPHSIFDGRRGACLVCLKKLEDAAESKEAPAPPAVQESLF